MIDTLFLRIFRSRLHKEKLMRIPLGVSVIAGVLALGLVGCARSAFAQTPALSPLASPVPSLTPFAMPPLPVSPPLVVADAGVLPTSAFSFFDRLDEFFERNIFSFGIPGLRARIALAQAAERIAELQALERGGQLTSHRVRGLVVAHERLLGIAQRIVVRQVEAGRVSIDLVVHLTRTELSAADVLEELLDELDTEIALGEPSATPRAELEEEEEGASEGLEDIADLLEDTADRLADFDDAVLSVAALPQAEGEPFLVPAEVLRILAEQKIAKAERDIASALAKIEERLAHGKVLVADVELRAGAELSLLAARQLFAAGNYAEALSVAKEARKLASVLKSGKIAIEPNALLSPRGEEKVEEIIGDLVEQGLLGTDEQAAAVARARAVVERVRNAPGVPPRRGGAAEDTEGMDEDKEDEADEENGNRSGSGSSGSAGSSRSGSGRD